MSNINTLLERALLICMKQQSRIFFSAMFILFSFEMNNAIYFPMHIIKSLFHAYEWVWSSYLTWHWTLKIVILLNPVRLSILSRNMMIIRLQVAYLCSAFLCTIQLLLPKLVPRSICPVEYYLDLLEYTRQWKITLKMAFNDRVRRALG